MLFSNINYRIPDFPDVIKKCLKFAKKNDLADMEPGSYEILGRRLFVNIVEYDTVEREERIWEAHRDYLDLHLMLKGSEIIDIGFIEDMKQGEYVPEDDFLPLEGERNAFVTLHPGDYLVCYPHDGHRTAVKNGDSEKIKKAIFKIKI